MQMEALGQLVQSYEKRIYWAEQNCLAIRRVLEDRIRQLQIELRRTRANSNDYLGEYTQHIHQQFFFQIEGGKHMSEQFSTTFNDSNIGVNANVVKDHAQQKAIQSIHSSSMKQQETLIQVANDVQKVLEPLEQINPQATESEQVDYLNDQTSPSFRRRVSEAFKAAGETALDEFVLENKYLKVAKAAAKGWVEAKP